MARAGAAQLSDSNLHSGVNETEIESGAYVDVCTPKGSSYVGMVRVCDDGMKIMVCGEWQFTIYEGDSGMPEACGVRTDPNGPVETVHDCVVIVTGEKADARVVAATNATSASAAAAAVATGAAWKDDEDEGWCIDVCGDDAGAAGAGSASASASAADSIDATCDKSHAIHIRVIAMKHKYTCACVDERDRDHMCSHNLAAMNQAIRLNAAGVADKLATANAEVAMQTRPRPYGSAHTSHSAYYATVHAAAALAYRIVYAKLTSPHAEKSENAKYIGCTINAYMNLARTCASESSTTHAITSRRTAEASSIALMKISKLSGMLIDAVSKKLESSFRQHLL